MAPEGRGRCSTAPSLCVSTAALPLPVAVARAGCRPLDHGLADLARDTGTQENVLGKPHGALLVRRRADRLLPRLRARGPGACSLLLHLLLLPTHTPAALPLRPPRARAGHRLPFGDALLCARLPVPLHPPSAAAGHGGVHRLLGRPGRADVLLLARLGSLRLPAGGLSVNGKTYAGAVDLAAGDALRPHLQPRAQATGAPWGTRVKRTDNLRGATATTMSAAPVALLHDLPGWERLQGTVAGRGDNGDAAGTARNNDDKTGVSRHGEAFGLRYELRVGEAV